MNKSLLIKHAKKVRKDIEAFLMTVINDVKTALAGLKSAQARFETFVLGTDNEQANQLYQDAAKQTQSVVDSIAPRVQQIEQEEPQYKQ
jgi:Protein of unknown function (DUF1657)